MKKFEVKNISYCIDTSPDGLLTVITPSLEFEAKDDITLIACLDVDSHELLPSARINLTRGSNSVELKPVKIVRPPKFRHEYVYKFDLHVSADGREYVTHSKEIAIAVPTPGDVND